MWEKRKERKIRGKNRTNRAGCGKEKKKEE